MCIVLELLPLQDGQETTQQHLASARGGDEKQQNIKFKGENLTDNENTAPPVDNILLQTLQDHMTQCYSTPCNARPPSNKPQFGVFCFEDATCLGEFLLSSPVLVIDNFTGDSIMPHIGFASFPNCNPTSRYIEYRRHIGLVTISNGDESLLR